MKIVVPLKQVPDLVEDLEVDATGKALDAEEVKLKLNEFKTTTHNKSMQKKIISTL